VLSTVMFRVDADVLAFVTVSVNAPEATVMTAVPPDESEPVNVAVYVVPDPESADSVPNVTVMSSRVNVDVVSLAVNVIVDVPPDDTEVGSALIVIVGAAVS